MSLSSSTKQTLIAAASIVAASQSLTDLETRGLKDDCVKMFFSNSSDKNRHFNKLRKAKAKKKAAKQARKRNRRK